MRVRLDQRGSSRPWPGKGGVLTFDPELLPPPEHPFD